MDQTGDAAAAAAELRARLAQQRALAELAELALGGAELPVLMDEVVRRVAEGLGVEFAKVLELLPDGDALLLRSGVGWREGVVGSATVGADTDSQAGYTLLSDTPVIVEDLSETHFSGPALLTGHGVVSGLSVIIRAAERPYGVLGAHTGARRSFSEHDVHFLETAARLLGSAIACERAKRELAVTNESLRALIDSSPLAIVSVDREGRVGLWNPAAERIFGRQADDVVGGSLPLVPPEAETAPSEIRARGRDGAEIELSVSAAALHGPGGDVIGTMFIAQDVTERKRLKAQLLEAQRLEGIGRLAGGVAHDFNNLLTAITGYSELLLARARPDDPSRKDLEQIARAGERATALTRQLLAFSRRQVLEPEVLDVDAVVAGMESMLRRLLGEDVEIVVRPGSAPARVLADRTQLEQVVLNLAVNARDAMPSGGRLTIETATLDVGHAPPGAVPPSGRWVLLSVSDTGVGMDGATKARLFDPFFTTKEVGKGTGLGLSTVHGIVIQSGGHVAVESEPGTGTTFRVHLPRVEAEAGGAEPRAASAGRGGERVLVVDDEDAVRGLMATILERGGYRVLAARGLEEAVRLVEEGGGGIDLLLTDLVMPGGGGVELAHRLAPLCPGLKVLYTSGYADARGAESDISGHGAAFIAKPFSPAALLAKVREVLDAPHPRSPET